MNRFRVVNNSNGKPVKVEYRRYNEQSKKYEMCYLCRYIRVTEVITNITNKSVKLNFQYYQAGFYQSIEFERSEMSKTTFEKFLLKIGLDVKSTHVNLIRDYIFWSEQQAVNKYQYSHVGWGVLRNENNFFLNRPLINYNNEPISYDENKFISTGSYEGWRADFEPILKSNHYLSTIFAAGLSAILLGYFNTTQVQANEKLLEMDSFVVSLVGRTSMGKSIAAQFCAGLYSSPYKSSNSVFATTNFTNNFAVQTLNGNNGVLQIFDDTSSTKDLKEYANIVYMLSQNQSRGRATKGFGQNAERASWSTLVLTTTEYSLSLLEDNRKGKFVRNIEFEFPYFTKSAEEATEIKEKLDKNYGVVAEPFANALYNCNNTELVESYKLCKQELFEASTVEDGLSDRIISNLACILLSAKIAQSNLKIDINIGEILNVLANVHDEGVLGRQALPTPLEYIQSFVAKNVQNFINIYIYNSVTGDEDEIKTMTKSPIYGNYVHDDKNQHHRIEFNRQDIGKVLIDGGYPNVDSILREWKEKGLILCDKGKNTKKCNINGLQVRCVVLILKYEENELQYTDKKTVIRNENVKALFDDDNLGEASEAVEDGTKADSCSTLRG